MHLGDFKQALFMLVTAHARHCEAVKRLAAAIRGTLQHFWIAAPRKKRGACNDGLLLSFIIGVLVWALMVEAKALPVVQYKYFSDYRDIKPILECRPSSFNCDYISKEKNKNCPNDSLYEDKIYLILRHGLYQAQVEKAMSVIYQYFMSYATDIDIVKHEGDYYVASRGFKNYIPWSKLNKSRDYGEMPGLGKIAALAYFFADDDVVNGDNFGIQKNKTGIRAIKIDNAEALESLDSHDLHTVDKKLIEKKTLLGKKIINAAWYGQEKFNMFQQIANTDFLVIAEMLRANITSSPIEMDQWVYHRFLKNNPSAKEKAEILVKLEKLNYMSKEQFNIEFTIKKLQLRHERLKQALALHQLTGDFLNSPDQKI